MSCSQVPMSIDGLKIICGLILDRSDLTLPSMYTGLLNHIFPSAMTFEADAIERA